MFTWFLITSGSGSLAIAEAICGKENKKCMETTYMSFCYALIAFGIVSISMLFFSREKAFMLSALCALIVCISFIVGIPRERDAIQGGFI